jgi:hypothetical protein
MLCTHKMQNKEKRIALLRQLLEVSIAEVVVIHNPDQSVGSLTSRVMFNVFKKVQVELGRPLRPSTFTNGHQPYEIEVLLRLLRAAARPLGSDGTNLQFDPADIAASARQHFWDYTPQQDEQVVPTVVSLLTVELMTFTGVRDLQTLINKLKYWVTQLSRRNWCHLGLPSNPFTDENCHHLDVRRSDSVPNTMLTDCISLIAKSIPLHLILCCVQT